MHRQDFELLLRAVRAAGEEARLAQAEAAAHTQWKADGSPVTAIDIAVERALRGTLQELWPEAQIIGEELGGSEAAGEVQVIIDPIDGTRAYLRGLDTWSTLLSLRVRGETVGAIANMPARQCCYYAWEGRLERDGVAMPSPGLSAKQLEDTLVQHGALGQFASAEALAWLPVLARHTRTQRGYADFAGYAELLEGRADLVVDPDLAPWDWSAPRYLVECQGGSCTLVPGPSPLRQCLIAGHNAALVSALCAKLEVTTQTA